MNFIGLIDNLKTYEMEMKVREDKAIPKKKNVAFKSTSILLDNNEDIDNEEWRALALSQECEKNVLQERKIQYL